MEELENDYNYFIQVEGEPDLGSPSGGTQSSFPGLQAFYDGLKSEEDLEEQDIEIIRGVFDEERIKAKQLLRLTDEILRECGLKQTGLRQAILSLLGI